MGSKGSIYKPWGSIYKPGGLFLNFSRQRGPLLSKVWNCGRLNLCLCRFFLKLQNWLFFLLTSRLIGALILHIKQNEPTAHSDEQSPGQKWHGISLLVLLSPPGFGLLRGLWLWSGPFPTLLRFRGLIRFHWLHWLPDRSKVGQGEK